MHETTHWYALDGPIAARHALEIDLGEQRSKIVMILRDDDPEMQILLGSPVHQMAYLKSVHRRTGLTAIPFRLVNRDIRETPSEPRRV